MLQKQARQLNTNDDNSITATKLECVTLHMGIYKNYFPADFQSTVLGHNVDKLKKASELTTKWN